MNVSKPYKLCKLGRFLLETDIPLEAILPEWKVEEKYESFCDYLDACEMCPTPEVATPEMPTTEVCVATQTVPKHDVPSLVTSPCSDVSCNDVSYSDVSCSDVSCSDPSELSLGELSLGELEEPKARKSRKRAPQSDDTEDESEGECVKKRHRPPREVQVLRTSCTKSEHEHLTKTKSKAPANTLVVENRNEYNSFVKIIEEIGAAEAYKERKAEEPRCVKYAIADQKTFTRNLNVMMLNNYKHDKYLWNIAEMAKMKILLKEWNYL